MSKSSYEYHNNYTLIFLSSVIFSIPIGYLTLLPFKKKDDLPFLIQIPLLCGVGYIMNSLWMYSIGSFTLNPIILSSLLPISIAIIFYQLNKTKQQLNQNKLEQTLHLIQTKNYQIISDVITLSIPKELVFVIIFILPVFLYGYTVENLQYSYRVDDEFHKSVVDAIFTDGHLDSTSLQKHPINYPVGTHVTIIQLSLFHSADPIRIGYVVSAVIVFFFYGVLLTITYQLTKSVWLSSLCGSSIFFLIPLNIYYFSLSSSGPSMFGYLSLVTLMSLLVVLQNKKTISFAVLCVLLLVGLITFYPLVGIYFIATLITYVIVNKINNFKLKNENQIYSDYSVKSGIALYILFTVIMGGIFVGGSYMISINNFYDNINPSDYPSLAAYYSSGTIAFNYIQNIQYVYVPLIVISLFSLFYFKEKNFIILSFLLILFFAISASLFGYFEGFFNAFRTIWIFLIPSIWLIDSIIISELIKKWKNNESSLSKKETIRFKILILYGAITIPSIILLIQSIQMIVGIHNYTIEPF